MELNELIYVGAKLVSEKVEIPQNNTKRNSKPGWEIWLETQIKNLRQQVKFDDRRKTWEYVGMMRAKQHN